MLGGKARKAATVLALGMPVWKTMPNRSACASLKSALKQARQAGSNVKGAVVFNDRIELEFGNEQQQTNDDDPWNSATERLSKQ